MILQDKQDKLDISIGDDYSCNIISYQEVILPFHMLHFPAFLYSCMIHMHPLFIYWDLMQFQINCMIMIEFVYNLLVVDCI